MSDAFPVPSALIDLLEKYFSRFGDKACCFEDLRPYITIDPVDLTRWTSFLESQYSSFARTALIHFAKICLPLFTIQTNVAELQCYINAQKLLRHNFSKAQLTAEAEAAFAFHCLQAYVQALEFGKDLPDIELQPADDLAILAGQAYIHLWHITQKDVDLYKAASVLEYACSKSKQSFQIRLLLIRIYRLLGKTLKRVRSLLL